MTTFDFLNDILDYGDTSVSPTTFSNSVHNAAASYVSLCLNIRGPTMTVTQFRFSFPAALQLAMAWLEQGRCDYALVGAADQYGDVLGMSRNKSSIRPKMAGSTRSCSSSHGRHRGREPCSSCWGGNGAPAPTAP